MAYPLYKSVMLDLASNIHITNSGDRLANFIPTQPKETQYARDIMSQVIGRGTMIISEERTCTLKNAPYIPDSKATAGHMHP